ncbi:hypothetical protein BV898_07063 [Hypsibius exemplaris]|uniref:Peptidase C1A papain C-terminal domain-containing protein n=1 Tax=Hypsibius exemplaris TaxID=2072580 RepID=A0A1W0WUC9_HYPEX|nr:hypothetical protein BV898_07063 [Hypsibius exemplaris]
MRRIGDEGRCTSCRAAASATAISDRICIASASQNVGIKISVQEIMVCSGDPGDPCVAGHDIFPSLPFINFYAATKHMVTALTKALNAEMRLKKIKTRSLSPGMVMTDFSQSLKIDEGGPGVGDAGTKAFSGFTPLTGCDIADAVVYMVGSAAHVNILELIIVLTEQPSNS